MVPDAQLSPRVFNGWLLGRSTRATSREVRRGATVSHLAIASLFLPSVRLNDAATEHGQALRLRQEVLVCFSFLKAEWLGLWRAWTRMTLESLPRTPEDECAPGGGRRFDLLALGIHHRSPPTSLMALRPMPYALYYTQHGWCWAVDVAYGCERKSSLSAGNGPHQNKTLLRLFPLRRTARERHDSRLCVLPRTALSWPSRTVAGRPSMACRPVSV